MGFLDQNLWAGKIYVGGVEASLDAFTETHWVTVRGDLRQHPF